MKLAIKNMVCNRCILVVRQELEKLGLTPLNVQLGEVDLNEELAEEQINVLRSRLAAQGFQLLDDRKSKIIEKVKNVIIKTIHGTAYVDLKTNFSTLISEELHSDYNAISSLFSTTEGITIEQYVILQRIERAKELLVYNELTLSEIAYKLGYSSVQHLSTQFKKVTGLTPSHFKTIQENKRKPLDQV